MCNKITVFLVLVFQSVVWQLFAAPIHNLNVENGLSNNFIHTIFQDSEGFVWIGTETGLDRYDGVSVQSYARRFHMPLKGAVQSIAESAPGQLVLGTSWGAFCYNVRSNHIQSFDFGVQGIDVRAVAVDKNGLLYFGTDKGLYRMNKSNESGIKRLPARMAAYPVVAFVKNNEEQVFAVGEHTLMRLSPGGFMPEALQIPAIKSAVFSDGRIYLGTIAGLYSFDIKTKDLKAVAGSEHMLVMSVCGAGKGMIYAGTDNNGLIAFDTHTGKQEQILHKPNVRPGLSSNSIYAVYHTQDVLFAGTFNHGLDIIPLQNATKFSTIDFLVKTGSSIRAQYIATNGLRYLGTRDGHFLCMDASGKILFNIATGFHSRVITTITAFPGNENMLLVGTFGDGVQLFDLKKRRFSALTNESLLQNARVYKFLSVKGNEIWIATLNGLFRYGIENGSVRRFDLLEACGSNELFAMDADAAGNIWIGTKTGVCYFDTHTQKATQPAVLEKYRYQCSSVYTDSKKNIWFCFNKGGVLKINRKAEPDLWLTNEILIPENAPSSVIEDRQGRIWIGSSKGLFVLNERNELHAFGQEDGLEGMNICPESALMDADAKLWWTNEFGLISFIDNEQARNSFLPNVRLNSFVINGTAYDPDTLTFVEKVADMEYKIRIKGKNNNNIGFGFTALSYVFPHKNRFFVRMQGVDSTYKALPGGQNVIFYNKLGAGTYTLEVLAANNDGVRSKEPLVLRFVVDPYFYETAWFVFLLILVGGGVLLYFTRHYIRLMRNRLSEQFSEIKRNRQQTHTLKIPETKGNDIIAALTQWMETEKAYLNPELRQADVADALKCQVHELSQVLNVQLGQSFPDFVNSYRVEEFLIRVTQPESDKYTLSAIAMQCGFSSKSSFLRAFKKINGMTPTEYLREKGFQQKDV
jgi:ligand-binding sensor domain-containing protein/AraC-like DNA-binding protein